MVGRAEVTEHLRCHFSLFAEGGICPPDTWAAGVCTKFRQSGNGSVVIKAMLQRRHCLEAQINNGAPDTNHPNTF